MAMVDEQSPELFYVGSKADLRPGDLIRPDGSSSDRMGYVHLTATFDAAAWESEVMPGEAAGRVYTVEPTGLIVDDPDSMGHSFPGPKRLYRSREPLRVTGECTDSDGHPHRLFHGTKADLKPGDMIEPGFAPNFGELDRLAKYVYLTGTLDAATWGAELALGEGPGRIYEVEPTGPIMDDPNLTNARFPGNPTKSYRSTEAVRVTGEVGAWVGHAPEVLQAMRDGLERLRELGVEPLDE
jgi:rifampin ADP-ribosylating transferase